jgi:hypothetical protein
LATALAVDEDLVGLAGRAGIAVSSGFRTRRTDLASAVHSSESLDATTALGSSVVDLIGSALLGTDAPLVGVEASETVAVLGGRVVGRIDGTGHTVSVGDEVP